MTTPRSTPGVPATSRVDRLRRRLRVAARSRRVAAWGTGLSALVVLVTVAVGTVAAGRDVARVADVTVSPGSEPLRCAGPVCTATWTISASGDGAVVDRIVVKDVGLVAEGNKRLLAAHLGSRALNLPSPDIPEEAVREDGVFAPELALAGGSSVDLRVVVARTASPPAPDCGPLRAVVTIRSGDVFDLREPAGLAVPCRG